MLIKIIRFFRGYVDFCAKGKFPERFLNITARYGVNLWNAHPIENGLEASMYISDYRKIRIIARKAKIKPKIKAKHGFPIIAFRYKPRIGLPIGAAAGLILMIVLSNFIWSVSITGTENISEARLAEVLAENGIKTGAYKNNLDVEKIERDTTLKIGEIGWMSVNITGNIASVEIKEKAEKPELSTNTNPCNIKAKCDGVITKINAKSGTTKVLKGSGVVKGDLLVSGITETKMNTIQYVHASAEVFADVISEKKLSIPKEYEYYSLTDNSAVRTRAFFLWTEFPCSLSFKSFEYSAYSEKKENLFCNNVVLPLGMKTETAFEIVKNKITLDKNKAQKAFENSLLLYEAFEKGKSQTVNRKMSIKDAKDEFICETDYVFNENIAESVDFSVTE